MKGVISSDACCTGAHSICGAWIESIARRHSMGHSMCGKHFGDVYQVAIAWGSHRICKPLTMTITQALEPSCSRQRDISPQLLSTYIQSFFLSSLFPDNYTCLSTSWIYLWTNVSLAFCVVSLSQLCLSLTCLCLFISLFHSLSTDDHINTHIYSITNVNGGIYFENCVVMKIYWIPSLFICLTFCLTGHSHTQIRPHVGTIDDVVLLVGITHPLLS